MLCNILSMMPRHQPAGSVGNIAAGRLFLLACSVPDTRKADTMSIKARLEKLTNERQDAIDKAKLLIDSAKKSEEGFTDEISAQVDELHATAKQLDEQIDGLLAKEKAASDKLDALNSFSDRSDDIRGVHVPSAPQGNGDQKKFTVPATARRYGRLKNFSGEEGGRTAEERAYRFGQWALARASMDISAFRGRFESACQFAKDQFGVPAYAVHGEGAGDVSGAHVFVPEEFGMDLVRLREMYGVARQLLRVIPMTSDTRTDPRRNGGLTAYFVGENSVGTESDASYDNIRLTAKKLMIITRMSNELGEDAVINFADELVGEISYAFANKEDECAFNGDGTSTYGGILGVRPALDTLTAGTAPGLILGAGNAYSELTLANFESVVGALPVYADTPNTVWVCHKKFYHTVMMSLALAAGGTTAMEIRDGVRRPIFLGYPVVFSQVFPSTSSNSQIPVIFGDLSLAARFGDRRMETIAFSDSVTVGGQSVWERDQMAVKGSERFDINVHDYGTNSVAGPVCGLEMAAS